MQLLELFDASVDEGFSRYGNRRPGSGNGFFMKRHYEYVVSELADIDDEAVRMDVAHWLAKAFKRDNRSFDTDRFLRWASEGKRGGRLYHSGGSPNFEQRHFLYMAHAIADEPDQHKREFLAHWIGDMFRSSNHKFKSDIWDRVCGVEEA